MSLILSGTDGLSDVDGSAATPAIRGTDANTGIFFPAADTIAFAEGGAEVARFDSSGNLGIGTVSPADKLSVVGTTNREYARIESTFSSSGSEAGIRIKTAGTNGKEYLILNANAEGSLRFYDATAAAERMRIDSSGNVGIGTSSPSYRLEVKGASATAGQLSIHDGTGDTVTSGNNAGSLLFQARDSSVRTIAEIDGVHTTTNGTGGAMVFQTRVSDVLAERMRIDSSGNLLFGTTQVSATNTQGMYLKSGATDTYAAIGHATGTGSGNGYMIFLYNGANIGYISQNGTTAVAYNTSSDYRLKENIAPMTGALAKVAQLKPVTYKWKLDGSDGQGFIAHELQQVIPDCVTGVKDAVETYTDEDGNEAVRPVHQGVDTSFLVATLTAAIQEQQVLITALTARITALETQNADNPVQGETP